MKNINDYLEKLELSPSEITLYLKLLQTGPISVRELAKITGTNRTSAYVHIDALVEKGLVSELVKGSRKEVIAQDPEESLENLIEKKVQTAKTMREEFPEVVKNLKKSLPHINHTQEAEIRYFKGKNAVKKIYEEALNSNELRSYVRVEESTQIFPDNITIYSDALKRNPKLTIKEIVYYSPFSKHRGLEALAKNERYVYKLMPKDLKLDSEDILIYDDKVAIINYSGRIITSMVLQNRDYYNNSLELFDFIWKVLP
jgi:HTH-type transcriptional regulator, sugar sensing transcriptional regulator